MLAKIYGIYQKEVAGIPFACREGCAACCTQSVTMTTAEGRAITAFLAGQERKLPSLPDLSERARPTMTTNELAADCLAGRESEPEAEAPWIYEPCVFLRNERCTIYPVRPFGCRSFGSTSSCLDQGIAEVPEWLVTLNSVVNQLLEDLDRNGFWGNMNDVLAYLDKLAGGRRPEPDKAGLLPTRPVPGFLVPPGEERMVNRFLEELVRSGGLPRDFIGK